jgi:hypothetical protein
MRRDGGKGLTNRSHDIEMGWWCTSRSSRKVSWRLCISVNGRNEGGVVVGV